MRKKLLLAGSLTLILLVTTILPVSAQTPIQESESQEITSLETIMDSIEHIASESQTFSEFSEKVTDLCQRTACDKNPVIREFIKKMLCFLFKEKDFYVAGININELLEKFNIKARPDFLVLSYGAYNRINPLKENSIDRFKSGLSMWRYSDTSLLLKGRTLVLERQPFGIHEKITGPQIGLMKGFKGLYIDVESKITGNSYVFFIGRSHRIKVFDLTPLDK